MKMNESIDKFDLKKVKKRTDGGLEIDYKIIYDSGDSDSNRKDSKPAHPDLIVILDSLKGYVENIFHYSEKNKPAIVINGISISGKNDKKGIVIMSKLKVVSGRYVAINTDRLVYKQSTYGYEEKLEEKMEELKKEVYAYLFEDKQAQTELGLE